MSIERLITEGVSNAFDTFITYKFLRALTQSWTDFPAYKLGIIDASGKVLRRSSTFVSQEEIDAASYFYRLVWNLKRLLEKLPGGKSKLVSYTAAAWLIKENKGLVISETEKFLHEEPVNVSAGAETKDIPLFKKKDKKDMAKKEGSVVALNRVLTTMKESKRIVKVIRGGSLKRKVTCSPDQHAVNGKCVTKTAKDKQIFKVASKKRQRKLAGKSKSFIIRKREKSMVKRSNMGL